MLTGRFWLQEGHLWQHYHYHRRECRGQGSRWGFKHCCLGGYSTFTCMHVFPNTKKMVYIQIVLYFWTGLAHLCEFIEDCEHTVLATKILHLLGREGPRTPTPSKYIRFIYNRVILEHAPVRAGMNPIKKRPRHPQHGHPKTYPVRAGTHLQPSKIHPPHLQHSKTTTL
jgi:hypothetical protein